MVGCGEIVGLLGFNGFGKSMLFNVIIGFEVIDVGMVCYVGWEIGCLLVYCIVS